MCEVLTTHRQRAANQGSVAAQNSLADAYAKGEGVARDMIHAYMWYNIAALKVMSSAAARDGIKRFMTDEEIADAKRLSADWKQRHLTELTRRLNDPILFSP
jgi:hypothetical protein